MNSLLEKFAGKVDLIYIDPPFATGADFAFTAEIGEQDLEVVKEQSAIEEKAYRDTWGGGLNSYVGMIYPRLKLIRDLLSPTGCVYVHCDWHVNFLLRAMLDDIFNADRIVNEIVWLLPSRLGGRAGDEGGRGQLDHRDEGSGLGRHSGKRRRHLELVRESFCGDGNALAICSCESD
jgi:DNA modification methylase